MYIMINKDDEFILTAHNKEILQEIALSIFDENMFEWFNNCINDGTINYEPLLVIINYAKQMALKYTDIEVFQLPNPID